MAKVPTLISAGSGQPLGATIIYNRSAMVRIEYSVELLYEVLQPSDFIFRIAAAPTPRQRVVKRSLAVAPDLPFSVESESQWGNECVRVRCEGGPLRIHYAAAVDIRHYCAQPGHLIELPVRELPLDVLSYVHPSHYCPSDQLYSAAVAQFGHLEPGYDRVAAICDWVRQRTTFRVGTTTPSHCALDTYRDRIGVCRDFAHLMISLCRALNIPARYVTSVDYGADPSLGPMDFHAYVEVYLSGGWYLFDPTGLVIQTGLPRIATGRDANDVAFATIFGAVQWNMPKVDIVAVEDASLGIRRPERTDLAISTSLDADYRSTPFPLAAVG